ncbi:MAG: preprotein translocase subunit Sec61beta [Candidatus Nanohaloarchaea archaeon]
MAQEEGGQLPGGMGGLVQYYDEYEEPFQFDPKSVVGFILALIGVEMTLHWIGVGLL